VALEQRLRVGLRQVGVRDDAVRDAEPVGERL
jgi:hypothetical protein